MDRIKLTKQFVDATSAPEGKDYEFFWDQAVRGFGIKITASGARTYVVQYRTPGGRSGTARRYTIGKHGSPWTVDTARNEARRVLGLVANGQDPALLKRKFGGSPTVAELCDDYMMHGTGTRKASTLATDRGRIDRHIVPLLGKKKVNQITQADIRRFMSSVAKGETATSIKTKKHGRAIVRGGKGTASRTLGLLGGIFSYAVQEGYVEDNPTHGVERYPDRKNERFLTLQEIKTVGAALAEMRIGREDNPAFDIISLLILTGARKGEIEGLKWSEVDFDTRCLRLADSKTGQKIIPLNSAAVETLTKLEPKRQRKSDWVFPATKGENHFVGTQRIWDQLRNQVGMPELRLHDLRHSFASVGVLQGKPLMLVGALLGHANASTTQRYAHLADDPIRKATEDIGQALGDALGIAGAASNSTKEP
ncbi:MAG: tyrosine-type recombinase/integrase [Alphaproteobacteria bacterium]|nr:tyrosine-type recombinase/integrase [Alphaproteobacteria bacterium]